MSPASPPPDAVGPDSPPTALFAAARERLRVERRRTVDEREAFSAFRSAVTSIPADQSAGITPAASPAAVRHERATGGRLLAVRDAYQSTVMSVPHYDEEYNDTYGQSLTAEFGPELAVMLTQESTLHPRSRASLLEQTATAIATREDFLAVLAAEIESVDAAADDLLAVAAETTTIAETSLDDARFGTLDAYRARLGVLEDTCDRVAARRQRDRDPQSIRFSDATDDIQSYLYQDLAVTYPVLTAVGVVGRRLESVRRAVEREMFV